MKNFASLENFTRVLMEVRVLSECQLLVSILYRIVALFVGLTESESDVKLAQSCKSAPTQLVTGTAERSSTRDAGQQTSEMQLMQTVAVTETVWTLSEPDTAAASTAAADAEHRCSRAATDDEAETGVMSPYQTELEIPAAETFHRLSTDDQTSHSAAGVTDDQSSKVTIAKDRTDNEETLLTDVYEDWEWPAPTAKVTKVCVSSRIADNADLRYPKTSKAAFKKINP